MAWSPNGPSAVRRDRDVPGQAREMLPTENTQAGFGKYLDDVKGTHAAVRK
jgi:hypothetical protein